MTTRVISTDLVAKAKVSNDGTGTVATRSEGTRQLQYLVCDDPSNHSPFENPRETKRPSETEGDGKCRSWPSRSTTPSWILRSIVLFDTLFVSWWILHVLNAYHEYIPLSQKRKLTFVAWEWYVWVHTLVCRWMDFYTDRRFYTGQKSVQDGDATISNEFKALSTLMYPVQFYPVNVPMMRFSLSQLNSVSLKNVPSEEFIERIECGTPDTIEEDNNNGFDVPESQYDNQTVSGLYVTNRNKTEANGGPKKVLFWIYGGAYLAGDAEGNISLANEYIEDCDADAVFIPSYRLAPEATIDGVLWDICWSYRYLLRRLESEQRQDGFEIIMVGISSGGALVLRLLQFLRDRSSKLPLMPSFLEPLIDDISAISNRSSTKVAGALLFAPYVDYRDPQPQDGSFLQNAKYDWVVTESVQHYGLPYLNRFIPPLGDDFRSGSGKNTNGRIQYSPLSHKMSNLPPLCLIASEHEACYDMSIEILNKARASGTTDVTIGMWKYMCHVFSMMQALLPEGKASIEFTKKWIRDKTTNYSQ